MSGPEKILVTVNVMQGGTTLIRQKWVSTEMDLAHFFDDVEHQALGLFEFNGTGVTMEFNKDHVRSHLDE